MKWKNLAPRLTRQRAIIEGTSKKIIKPPQIKKYLLSLANITGMEIVSGPHAYSAHELGFGGWVHWRTSGCHFYIYPTSPPLFTVDIYTCKPFSISHAARFTRDYFSALDLYWREIKI